MLQCGDGQWLGKRKKNAFDWLPKRSGEPEDSDGTDHWFQFGVNDEETGRSENEHLLVSVTLVISSLIAC